MAVLTHQHTSLLSFIRPTVNKLAHSLLSWRIRRLIFLSSVYATALQVSKLDKDHADKLAKVLNIARDHRAMELPVAIKSIIWYKTNPDCVFLKDQRLSVRDLVRPDLSEQECDAIAAYIVQVTPVWLRYAKMAQMVYDVKSLAKQLHTNKES